MIQESKWRWYGNAGHLCVGEYCRFHLTTRVGEFLVSTVGDYFPDSKVAEICKHPKDNPQEIGCGRLFETMVFLTTGPCPCGCGMPAIDAAELDFSGYNDRKAANEGHLRMCREWAKHKSAVKRER